jgi:hypothetical protein
MARMLSPPPAASRQSLEFFLTSLVWCSGHFGTTTVLKTVAQVEQLAAKQTTKIKKSACLGRTTLLLTSTIEFDRCPKNRT